MAMANGGLWWHRVVGQQLVLHWAKVAKHLLTSQHGEAMAAILGWESAG